jgi:hypothetical protein
MSSQPSLIIRKARWQNEFHRPDHPPLGWLGELVSCMCGHGIGRHATGICEGDLGRRCMCRLDPRTVLDQAMLAVSE